MLALRKRKATWRTVLCLAAALMLCSADRAAASAAGKADPLAARKELYEQMSAATGIPWFRFAAIDQYERTIAKKKSAKEAPDSSRITGISIPAPVWAGPLNPDQADTSPESISFLAGWATTAPGTAMPIRTMMPTCSTAWPGIC